MFQRPFYPLSQYPPTLPMIQEFLFMERFVSFEHKWSENMVHGEKTIVSGEEQEIIDGDFYFWEDASFMYDPWG
ncbi:hypothetical protein CEXT_574731 [Caerostris extrusa]|uniref:Uncharacterized protein n=1 Tax=Caerostris extrusa TaxID=172846 RepID=A0AAV4U4N5_CAEEX|nr:hypothetical protein CEXT_574731 [Caerostris extrusa]